MAGEAFRTLAAMIGQIQRSIGDLARLAARQSREQGRGARGDQARAQLGAATGNPAIIRSLQDVLRQRLGGGATNQIRDATRDYMQSMRTVITERRREVEATRRFAQAYAAAQQYLRTPGISIQNWAAIQAGTISPAAAHAVGGQPFRRVAQRMQTARARVQSSHGRGIAAQGAARMAAARGRQAALGPQGIPQGGGAAALGRVAAGSGMGGMGTLVGSLFGQAGAGLGFAFDMALKAVTVAFRGLETTVKNSRLIIDKLSVWSFGGMQAAITLTIAEIHKQIKMSGELGNDMIRFANAQKRSIEAWVDFDIAMERINLGLATAWENVKAFAGEKVGGPAGRALKEDPIGSLVTMFRMTLTTLGPVGVSLGSLIKYLQGKDDEGKVHEDLSRPFTPWEKKFKEMEQAARGIRMGGVDVWGNELKEKLRMGAGGLIPGGGPGQGGIPIPGGPGGPAGKQWKPPQPIVPQPQPQNPQNPQPPQPQNPNPPKQDPVEQILNDIAQNVRRAINALLNLPPNLNLGGGGGP